MKKQDMKSQTRLAFGINATLSGTTPAKGNIVYVGDHGAATFGLIAGTVTDAGTATGITWVIQESDTTADADFTAVADVDLVGTEAGLAITLDTADGAPVGLIGYVGSKAYVRAVATGTTGTDAAVAGIWLLQHPRYAPQGDVAANVAAT